MGSARADRATGGAGTKHPKDAIEHVPRVPPGLSASVRSARRVRDQRLQDFPLLVGKVHGYSPVLRTGRGPLYKPSRIYEIGWSDKQTQANRQNALKSTGPKTPEGKAAVRHNALKHGLLTQDVLLPNEDEAVFEDLDERLREELRPVGELEGLLVDRIVAAHWRLRRLGRVEAGIFASGRRRDEAAEERNREVSSIIDTLLPSSVEPPPPEASKHLPEHPEVLSEAERAKSRKEDETVSLGRTFIRDASEANASPSSPAMRPRWNVASTRPCMSSNACRPPAGPAGAAYRRPRR